MTKPAELTNQHLEYLVAIGAGEHPVIPPLTRKMFLQRKLLCPGPKQALAPAGIAEIAKQARVLAERLVAAQRSLGRLVVERSEIQQRLQLEDDEQGAILRAITRLQTINLEAIDAGVDRARLHELSRVEAIASDVRGREPKHFAEFRGAAAVVTELLAQRDEGRVEIRQLRAEAERRSSEPTRCPVHDGLIHGGEAEELRAGIEALLERHHDKVQRRDLIALLDRVNARDSLAHLERGDLVAGCDVATPGAQAPERPDVQTACADLGKEGR